MRTNLLSNIRTTKNFGTQSNWLETIAVGNPVNPSTHINSNVEKIIFSFLSYNIMASSYYYVKKSRFLRKQKESDTNNSEQSIRDKQLVQEENVDASVCEVNKDILNTEVDCNLNDLFSQTVDDTRNLNLVPSTNTNTTEVPTLTLSQKLKYWALSNITVLTNKCISELLNILRSEGHINLPRRAESLLGTCHARPTQIMMTKRGNEGFYIYIGIEEALKKRINENNYKEGKIHILVNIDGIPLFRSSRQQFWPILI